MSDGIARIGAAQDLGRAVERIAAAVRQDTRHAGRQQWLGQVGDALRQAQPLVEQLASAPVDPVALGEARERIAAMLAEVDALGAGLGARRSGLADALDGLAGVAIPLAPGASEDAVAAAQALARLIAANARPTLAVQARLGASAVRTAIGE